MATSPEAQMEALSLKNPRSIAAYDSYADAQRAVDYLSDSAFPVESLQIVGTDLKSVERVVGGLNWPRVLLAGAMSGVAWGLLLAVLLWVVGVGESMSLVALFAWSLLFGVIYGMIAQAVSYGMSRGERDFSSVKQIVATRYEILGEAEYSDQARAILSGGSTVVGAGESVAGPVSGGTAFGPQRLVSQISGAAGHMDPWAAIDFSELANSVRHDVPSGLSNMYQTTIALSHPHTTKPGAARRAL